MENEEIRTWLSCDPYLFKTAGDFQDPASCTAACSSLWQSVCYVSNDYFYRRSRADFAIVEEVKQELDAAEIPYKVPEQGVMIETPAAVMISEDLAQMVDFFSIGTNDLTQYTLAIDRQNEKLDDFYNAHHKAILMMIRMVVENAHKYGKWAGICGELGADLELTDEFMKMGVDELSVAPGMILKLRKRICEFSKN